MYSSLMTALKNETQMKYAPSAYQGAILMIYNPSVDGQRAQLINATAELAAMSLLFLKYHSVRINKYIKPTQLRTFMR